MNGSFEVLSIEGTNCKRCKAMLQTCGSWGSIMRLLVLLSLLLILFTSTLDAQTIDVYSQYGRELIEGAKNNIKLVSKFDTLKMTVSVSNGSIERGTVSRTIYQNKQMLKFEEDVFFWTICEKGKDFEKLYVDYYNNDSIVQSDTILFYTKESPIVYVKAYKASSTGEIFDLTIYDDVTPVNVVGIKLHGIDMAYGFNSSIKDYKIDIIIKNKIVKTLHNVGSKLTSENKKIITSYNRGFIKIRDVNAFLECGLKMKVKDVDSIFY